jgi:hypothetical protein
MAEPIGISSIEFGRALTALGLRCDGMPTAKALEEGYAQRRFNGSGLALDWHFTKTGDAVAGLLRDEHSALAIKAKRVQSKHEIVLAQHLCGHEAAVGRRPSRKRLEEVNGTLCVSCLSGDKVKFSEERSRVLTLCDEGDMLTEAIEAVVEDWRLRPGVFLACWGKWAHEEMEKVLNKYRGTCEKPGSHPEVLAAAAALGDTKQKELDRLIRAASHAQSN